MGITAKTSTIRNALSNALAALANAKPAESFTVSSTPSVCTIEGTRSTPLPLVTLSADNGTALCAMLGVILPQNGEVGRSDAAALRALQERLDVAHRHLDEQARATVAIVEGDQRKLTHLQGQLAEAHSEIRALTKSLDGVARQPQRAPVAQALQTAARIVEASVIGAEPVSIASGRSLLEEIAAATVGEPVHMVEITPSPVVRAAVAAALGPADQITITFPQNEQGKTLAKARMNVQSLKDAGFVFKFTDRKDHNKGGHWSAPSTHESRQLASLLSAYITA